MITAIDHIGEKEHCRPTTKTVTISKAAVKLTAEKKYQPMINWNQKVKQWFFQIQYDHPC